MTPRISPLPQLDENLLQEQISKCSASSSSSVEVIDTPDDETKQQLDEVSVTDGMEHLEINSEVGELVDDTISNASDSSRDTLEDFCIVPLPECFDRTIPLDRSETRSSLGSRSDIESLFTDSGVVGSTEVDAKTVDDILATSQADTQQEPLIPVTLTSPAAPTLVSTITVAIRPANTEVTTEALPSAPILDQGAIHDDSRVDVDDDNNDDEANDIKDDDNGVDDTQGEASDDAQGDGGDDNDNERPDNEDIGDGAFGEGDPRREEPAFDPVKAMEYAGELAVQAISAAARTGGSVVHAIFNNQKVPPESEWPKEGGMRSPMDQLMDMGFCNRELNSKLLDKHSNNLERVVQDLVNEADNDWHSNRH
ncbi:uncharacterized protein LOC144450452 [Glandiceps talaboti]